MEAKLNQKQVINPDDETINISYSIRIVVLQFFFETFPLKVKKSVVNQCFTQFSGKN